MELLNTKLDAVNFCLSGIGREPVAALDTPDLDAAMALSVLQRSNLEIQNNGGRGWWFNQERDWNLEPDDEGIIYLPNNTLSIIESRGYFYDIGNRLTVRGTKVYDTSRHTFDLHEVTDKGGNVNFTLLLLLSFEDLPVSARSAIAWDARTTFSDDTIGEQAQHKINRQQSQRAFGLLETENRRTVRSNYLRDNARVNAQVGRVGGYNNLY